MGTQQEAPSYFQPWLVGRQLLRNQRAATRSGLLHAFQLLCGGCSKLPGGASGLHSIVHFEGQTTFHHFSWSDHGGEIGEEEKNGSQGDSRGSLRGPYWC